MRLLPYDIILSLSKLDSTRYMDELQLLTFTAFTLSKKPAECLTVPSEMKITACVQPEI